MVKKFNSDNKKDEPYEEFKYDKKKFRSFEKPKPVDLSYLSKYNKHWVALDNYGNILGVNKYDILALCDELRKKNIHKYTIKLIWLDEKT